MFRLKSMTSHADACLKTFIMGKKNPTEYWVVPNIISAEIEKRFRGDPIDWTKKLNDFVRQDLKFCDPDLWEIYGKGKLDFFDVKRLMNALNLNKHYGVTVKYGKTDILDILCYFAFGKGCNWKSVLLKKCKIDETRIYKRIGYEMTNETYMKLQANNCENFEHTNIPYLSNDLHSLEAHPVSSNEEFEAIDNLYRLCFGINSVPSDRLNSWWRKFPNGIVCIYTGKNLVGGVSMWPIDTPTFNKLRKGIIKEREISSTNLVSDSTGNKWYFSEIAIAPEYRDKPIFFLVLLKEAIINLERELADNFPSTLLAEGFSEAGRKLLSAKGFIKELEGQYTADKLPIYSLTLNDKLDLERLKGRAFNF